jgi:hypothetical protein
LIREEATLQRALFPRPSLQTRRSATPFATIRRAAAGVLSTWRKRMDQAPAGSCKGTRIIWKAGSGTNGIVSIGPKANLIRLPPNRRASLPPGPWPLAHRGCRPARGSRQVNLAERSVQQPFRWILVGSDRCTRHMTVGAATRTISPWRYTRAPRPSIPPELRSGSIGNGVPASGGTLPGKCNAQRPSPRRLARRRPRRPAMERPHCKFTAD